MDIKPYIPAYDTPALNTLNLGKNCDLSAEFNLSLTILQTLQ